MSDYEARLLEEKAQLEERVEKLKAFLATDTSEIENVQLQLLFIQMKAMETYLQCLSVRVESLLYNGKL